VSSTLTIHDETTSGRKTHTFTLDCLTVTLSVRELIRARIYQEVHDYNHGVCQYFRGLVAPTESEPTAEGYKLRQGRRIDWQQQFERALEAFENKEFLVLVGDQEAHSLHQEFEMKADTEVSFIKMMPLVCG
jgi:DNA-binding PucR family transcriptional regulator